jgi:uncharacterized membrane protein
MIEYLLAAAAAAQIVPLPTPAPPAPHPAWIAEARDRYVESLRSKCMSERGIAAVIEIWWPAHQPDPALFRRERDLRDELFQAANADPVDLPRLERALTASEGLQTEVRDRVVADHVRILRSLEGSDRAVYARTLSLMQAAQPPKACPPGPAGRR